MTFISIGYPVMFTVSVAIPQDDARLTQLQQRFLLIPVEKLHN